MKVRNKEFVNAKGFLKMRALLICSTRNKGSKAKNVGKIFRYFI